jgi:hypothetical protein
MRYDDDDDNSQSFGPVLRRIAVLAVIITAVPVTLWSITAVMRTYVAQPVIQSARPLASVANPNAASALSADSTDKSKPRPPLANGRDQEPTRTGDESDHPGKYNNAPAQVGAPVVEARTTATDADGKSGQLNDSTAPAPTSTTASIGPVPAAPMSAASPAPQINDQTAANSPGNSANSPWPNPSKAVGGPQSQTATAVGDSSDALLPASAPLTGPIPLPPHRPKVLAMADGPVPLPRKRPAHVASDDPPPDSGNFLTHLFGLGH